MERKVGPGNQFAKLDIAPVFIEFTGFYLELSFKYLWSSLALPGVIVPVFIEFTGFYLELSLQY